MIKLEKEMTCDFCNDFKSKPDGNHLYKHPDGEFIIMADTGDSFQWGAIEDIKYCPYCGRRLEEIKLEKRLMQWCEDCEDFAPCCFKLREETEDKKSFDINTVIICRHADICSNAVQQYQKSCENTPIVNDPSPCKACKTLHKESCCGCRAYFEWRKKYDD